MPSIKNQTYQNYEVIIEYDKKKQGAAAMRNKGARKAKGSYLFFCDNDVELAPDALESLYKHLKKNEWAKWCFARVMIDGQISPNKPECPPKDKQTERYLQYFYCISTMSLIDAKAKPKWDESFQRYDDWDLWVSLDKSGKKGVFLDKVILKTKNRPNGITMKNDREEALAKLRIKHNIDPNKKIADIIIPHHNRHDLLKNCLEQIDNRIFNIIILSGGSFSENCNAAAKSAKTDTLIFLNDDVVPRMESLIELAESKYDYCGISQYIGSVKYYGIGWDKGGKEAHQGWFLADTPEKFFIPSGFCMKFSKKLWEKLSGLSEEYRNGAEDLDIGLRALKLGAKVGFIDFPMVHMHSQSEGRFDHAGDNDKIFSKHWRVNDLIKLKNVSKHNI